MIGLQKIYPGGRPQSEGQAAALELVHQPPKTCVIVLPTSSGKSVLFFSVAAMVQQQSVIVVVPFAALVDDIVQRGRDAGLQCEEWTNPRSCLDMQQLVVVSADRAVGGEFLHFVKGLEVNRELAHMFFDECHVTFTDTSYRERLRELWKLRYLNCPFTCLTATLMLGLEKTLQERLLIEGCIIFRRATARRTIRYTVVDSREQAATPYGIEVIKGLVLPHGKRGVVYVRSYSTGKIVSEALECPFYKATAEGKGEILQQWSREGGGWIVATGALGTGINIPDIIYVIHIDRPYGLTSFAQQSGRGGRGGEVSDSIIIVQSQHTQGRNRKEVLSAYSVEEIDEEGMTEFIQTKRCRRIIMAKYFDQPEPGEMVDCHSTDSVLCDYCKVQSSRPVVQPRIKEEEDEVGFPDEVSGTDQIASKLQAMAEADEVVIKVMQYLKGQCVYCEMMSIPHITGSDAHRYSECSIAQENGFGKETFREWRDGMEFAGLYEQCFECGLSQRICQRLEHGNVERCEYEDIMLPGIFILSSTEVLEKVVHHIGFQGEYETDIWEWMDRRAEGFGEVIESNWSRTWGFISRIYYNREGK